MIDICALCLLSYEMHVFYLVHFMVVTAYLVIFEIQCYVLAVVTPYALREII